MVANSPSKKCPTLVPPLHPHYLLHSVPDPGAPPCAPLPPTLDVAAKTINQNPEQ